MSDNSQLLTYTKNYGSVLSEIQVNKTYSFKERKRISSSNITGFYDIYNGTINKSITEYIITKERETQIYNPYNKNCIDFKFEWNPKEGETTFNIDNNISIIDYIYIIEAKNTSTHNDWLIIIDNYGNIHKTKRGSGNIMKFNSDVLLKREDRKVLSDQVIDYIKKHNLICNVTLTTNDIIDIQNIAGMGQEKIIKYELEQPQKIINMVYDKNDIIQDLILSFPGVDPWEKAKELMESYKGRLIHLFQLNQNESLILSDVIEKKNTIKKMIRRNKDIDDDDIKALIEMKKEKVKTFELQIDELMNRHSLRCSEINKLEKLLCKLSNISKKEIKTEFI